MQRGITQNRRRRQITSQASMPSGAVLKLLNRDRLETGPDDPATKN